MNSQPENSGTGTGAKVVNLADFVRPVTRSQSSKGGAVDLHREPSGAVLSYDVVAETKNASIVAVPELHLLSSIDDALKGLELAFSH
ncbi:MAG: hypothetical protein HOK61_02845 [Alphaproteobacteria bacterium]|jgi:hypothetical protein|nr:hypothetical protein [Alphaproteobacteria bacterium]